VACTLHYAPDEGACATCFPLPNEKMSCGEKSKSESHTTWEPGKAHFNDTARDLRNGSAALPQWVQDDGKRRTEAPEDPDDDPCCESTHAINGACEEERKRDQNKHDNSLAGIKSSESVPEREGEITD
jgi:hypothetical protein